MKTKTNLVLIAIVVTLVKGNLHARPMVSLDGRWAFRFAPDDTGEQQGWYKNDTGFDSRLIVPGCWDAQGVGDETDKMRHQAVGVGWYRRMFELPADWSNKRVWLHIGGAHRSARVWMNEQFVGEHWGYPVAFRFDITRFLEAGSRQTLVIAVDSRRHSDRDPLTGTFDIIDYMDIDWGGIQEHVWLECTDDVWLDNAFIRPDPDHAKADVEVTLCHIESATPGQMTVAYTVHRWSPQGASGKLLDAGQQEFSTGDTKAQLRLNLEDAPLWTPAEPNLLILKLQLRQNGQAIDEKDIRFGQRRLEIRSSDFYLNGERFFLRGYGDDYNFPRELVPPADVGYWRDYLQLRKNYGFNGVRHHSMIPTESYFAAADEVGMLIQPELPIAYRRFLEVATEQGRELYRYVWKQHILQLRNHPSVMAWCMGNELYNGLPFDQEFYETAKRLDPTRPVISTDGMILNKLLNYVDYASIGLNEWAICWGPHRHKYCLSKPLDRPLIVHEMSNLCALPDPADLPLFTGAVKPFWLEKMREAVRKQGLQRYLPAMISASERLQASLLKLTFEAARLSPDVDGYHQWLFRDYWMQSSGLVNYFDRPRRVTQAMARQFNSESAILWDRDRASFYAGENIDLQFFLSDFRPTWQGPIDTVSIHFNDQTIELKPVTQSGSRGLLGPYTGTITTPQVSDPQMLMLTAEAGHFRNEWPLWVFPKVEAKPQEDGGSGSLICARRLTEKLLDQLASGRRVWLMDERYVLSTEIVQFKNAWWLGKPTNTNYGNMIVPHPAMGAFPHEGYGDLQMSFMMDNRPVVLMDKLPQRIEPIIWSIDLPWRMWWRAYLFEARVGKGQLLVSTLRFTKKLREEDPATAWLYQDLLDYANSDAFQPKGELPVEWLQDRIRMCTPPDAATWRDGYKRVIENTEPSDHSMDYALNRLRTILARQTDGRQIVRWATANVPAKWPHKTVTFLIRGGFGEVSQPEGGHFTLSVNGKQALEFPFGRETAVWSAPSGVPRLLFFPRYQTDEDSTGLFFLTVPTDMIEPDKAAELTVQASAQNSRRWFGINPYSGLASRERMDDEPW